ncbi:MAG: hypothetical protein DRJ65_05040 [Acidobacteria bacterium]|nr:MAG: hypothetical protein DRJ65_05040 [Acidobacteriota bacterium]
MYETRILVGGLALFVAALAGVMCLGSTVRRASRLKFSEPLIAEAVLGTVSLLLAAALMACFGLYLWPVLVVLVLAPLVTLPATTKHWKEILKNVLPFRVSPMAWATGLVILIAVLQTAAPAVHFDLLVNYLGVARDELLQGHLGALPYNIHSALSLPLHILGAFVLALGEPLNLGPFSFGSAPLWSLLIAASITASVLLIVRLVALCSSGKGKERAWTGWAAATLWLVTPQTLLLAQLQSAEFVITVIALALAVTALAAARSEATGDLVIVGLLGGILVACKPHSAVLVLVAWGIAGKGRPPRQIFAGLAAGMVLPLVTAIRSALVFGHPLFPWMGPADPAAAALMAENSVSLTINPIEIGHRLFRLATLQPESGVLFAVIILGLLGRRRFSTLWFLGGLQVLALVAATGNTVNTLRWAQPVLPILIAASLIGLNARFADGLPQRVFRYGFLALLVCGLVLSLVFSQRTTGIAPQLGLTSQEYLSRRIPRFDARKSLALRDAPTLMLGEIIGAYTAPGCVIPGPQNGRWAREALQRPEDFELLWIAPEGLEVLRRQPTWEWLDDGGMDDLQQRIQTARRIERLPGAILIPLD